MHFVCQLRACESDETASKHMRVAMSEHSGTVDGKLGYLDAKKHSASSQNEFSTENDSNKHEKIVGFFSF